MKKFLNRHIGTFVIGIIGLLLSVFTYNLLLNWQKNRANQKFAEIVSHKHNLLKQILKISDDNLSSLQAFFHNSIEVTRKEFRGFSYSLFARKNKKLDGFYWLPKVREGDADLPDNPEGNHYTLHLKSGRVKFPIAYKYKQDFPLFELDSKVLDLNEVREALRRGIATEKVQTTGPFQVKMNNQNNWVMLLLYPVFGNPPNNGSGEIIGFTSGIFNFTKTVNHVFDRPHPIFAHFSISHDSEKSAPFLHMPSESLQKSSIRELGWKRFLTDDYTRRRKLKIAQSTFFITYSASPTFIRNIEVWPAPAGSAVVLLLTGLLIFYIKGLKNNKRVIEKKVEEQTRKLKKANQAKSEFLAKMSHEIRTPLNALMGMTDLLERTSLDDEQKEYVKISKESSEVLLNLINDILDFSKVEDGQIDLFREPFRLAPFVNDTVSYFAQEAWEKGLEMHVIVAGDCPAVIREDKDRLRQVLINLLKNAIKFTETGEINVHVCFEKGSEENRLHFEVEDTGIGIPEEKQECLFERFSQVNVTHEEEGTGLGLSIAKELIELMGGTISVESEVGKGSAFHFQIPVHLPDGEENQDTIRQEKSVRSGEDFSGVQVLVVDDSSTNRLLLNRMFTDWGAEVTEAEDGREGLEKIERRQDPFDLIFLDRDLPDVDGFDVVEQMKNGNKDHVVVMLRPDSQMEDRKRANRMNIGDYIVKPVVRSALQESINQVFDREVFTGEKNTYDETDLKMLQKPVTVLVAEDNKYNRKLMSTILKEHPVEYEFAENGKGALDMAKSTDYDLIFMDIRLPELNGLEVTKAYRKWEEEHNASHTPIIALTAQALEENRQESIHAGCDDHFSKPIKEKDLIKAIRQYVDFREVRRSES